MNADECLLKHSDKLMQAIYLAKAAISRAVAVKKEFQENALVAKNQVHDDISFHLELLRNREVWLHEQVDINAQIKEETYENHLNELFALLAKLEVCKKLVESKALQDGKIISDQAEEIISQVELLLPRLGEESGIYFSADNFALSNALRKYGSIDERKSCKTAWKPLQKFANKKYFCKDGYQEPAFLQEHFKQVAGSSQNDWLLPGGVAQETKQDYGVFGEFCDQLKRSDNEEWLCNKSLPPMDLNTFTNRIQENFQRIKSSPDAQWLQPGTVPSSDDPSHRLRHRTFDTSESRDSWLLRPIEGMSLSTKSDELTDEGISLTSHFGVDERESEDGYTEKNHGKGPCLVDDKVRCNLTADQLHHNWLITPSTSHPVHDTETITWLQRFRDSNGASNSDWLLGSENTIKPEYCEWLTQESIDRCANCPGDCDAETLKVFRNVLNSSRNEWLSTVSDW